MSLLSLKGRETIFSHQRLQVLKLLPTIFLQRVSEEEEARGGEASFSQALGCLDVTDGEEPVEVDLRGEDFSGEKKPTGTESWSQLEEKLGLTFSQVPHRGTRFQVQH